MESQLASLVGVDTKLTSLYQLKLEKKGRVL